MLKNYKIFEKKFNMGAYGKIFFPYAPMLNIFLQNSKKFQKNSGVNIKKILKNYKIFEKKFNMGAYGKILFPYAPMLNIFLQNSKKFQNNFGENKKNIGKL